MVTLIATGFASDFDEEEEELTKRVYDLDSSQPIKKDEEEKKDPPPPAESHEEQPSQEEQEPSYEDELPARDPEREEEERILREMSSSRKYLMMKEAYERKLKLKGRKSISSPENSEDMFKKEDFYNQPAYVRRNIHLYSAPAHDDRNVSRYSLDDEDNIIGNNKFLHDNVD